MKSLLLFLLCLLMPQGTLKAESSLVREKKVLFKYDDAKMRDVHYGAKLLPSNKFKQKFPKFHGMDGLKISQDQSQVYFAKSVMTIPLPATFFTSHKVMDESFIKTLYAQPVKKIGDYSFLLNPSQKPEKLDIYYDADDLSSIEKSSIVKAVLRSKDLDILSRGSSATVVEHFSGVDQDKVKVTNFISKSAKETILVTYWILAPHGKNSQQLNRQLESELRELAKNFKKFKRQKSF